MSVGRVLSPPRATRRFAALVALSALVTGACSQDVERVPQANRPTNAHEAYRYGLIQAELGGSALARDWMAASEAALRQPAEITTPFLESGYFEESTAAAIAYTFTVARGQRVDASVEIEASEPLRIFMDLFRLADDDPLAPVHVASGAVLVEPPAPEFDAPSSAPEHARRLSVDPLRDGTYILRVQPELLRSARYTVRVTVDASLSFPVAERTTRAIQSTFGVDRDAGRRSHRGVDIFATRGTPVLAASDGVVTRANTTEVGGNVVWVSDASRNLRLYYAHLDTHTVERGQRVKAGDQLGTVGNTGNAITTPPHLHFGVYARGAVDPYPFLERMSQEPEELSADPDGLGSWARTNADTVEVRVGPGRRARIIATLARHTPLRVWGASARWYRVDLPEGGSGYVAAATTEPATPLRSEAVVHLAAVRDRPEAFATIIDELGPGAEVPVLGEYGEFLYVLTPAGRTGWLAFE